MKRPYTKPGFVEYYGNVSISQGISRRGRNNLNCRVSYIGENQVEYFLYAISGRSMRRYLGNLHPKSQAVPIGNGE